MKIPCWVLNQVAILTFRDEYLDLADDEQFDAAKELSRMYS